jgi:hypothetical protein
MASGGASGAKSPLTTKGDIWGFSIGNARIPVGADGEVLTADSTQPLGVKYALPAGATFLGCSANATATVLPMNVPTPIQFTTENYDFGGFHDNVVNNTRFTVPPGEGGIYLLTFVGAVAAFVGLLGYAVNGGSPIMVSSTQSQINTGNFAIELALSAGDFVEFIINSFAAATTAGAGTIGTISKR